jgi:ATP-dependent DNA ligase
VDRPPAGPGWLHEIKHDGFHILAWKQGERVTVWSRGGADFTRRFSRITDAVRGVSADEAMIDGEAVVFLDDGRSAFHALLTKHGLEQAALVAFDYCASTVTICASVRLRSGERRSDGWSPRGAPTESCSTPNRGHIRGQCISLKLIH